MSISGLFIRRPVMTTLVMLAILLFGLIGYRDLPVSDLPTVDYPTIMVSAGLPGANPDTMAAAVATPLERQFSTIAGLDSMTSSNSQGSTRITLQFSLDRDIDAAAQDVQSAIATAQRRLPSEMPSPPSMRKVNPADAPVLMLSMNSPTLPLSAVDDYAETFVGQRISMVSGVAQVQVYGAAKYAVRIQLDPSALASRKIGVDEVADAVGRANVNLPSGTLSGPFQALTVQSNGQLFDASAYRPVIVTYRNGAPVRLEELGRVLDSVENDKSAGWFNNRPSVMLAIQRQPGTNTVEVVDSIRQLMPTFRELIPASVNLDIMYDRSVSIRESVQDVKFTLLLALLLVILVIFLFLRNLSATMIPSLAMPMSIFGTFGVMYLLNYSIDNLSLMALTLSVGFVVDDAIVMLENIVRHMEYGEGAWKAAYDGAREIGFTIVSMTLSLAAVFIPVLFMGGILGRLLQEFAVTIGVAILVSGFVSLSLTPMLCSLLLRPPGTVKHGGFYRASERAFDGMRNFYDWSLRGVLRHRFLTLVASLVILVATIYIFVGMPKGFLPSEDTGQISGSSEAAEGTSFNEMSRLQLQLATIISQDPNVDAFNSSVGSGPGGGAVNSGWMFIRLKDRRSRRVNADQVIEELRPKLARIPGVRMFLQNPPPIRIGGYMTRSQYQFALQCPDTAELYHYAPILEAKLRDLPGLQDVTSDLRISNPQVDVLIDRDRASALGLTPQQIQEALYTSYASRLVSTIYAPNDEYEVIMELLPEYQADASALKMLYVRSSNGALVSLDSVSKLDRSVGALSVNHLGQLPAVTLSFNLKPGTSLGDAVTAVQGTARETLPDTISTSFQGAAQAFEASTRGLGILLIMTILVIYIVLGILYESFIHPLTILSGLPSAGLGALLTLMLFQTDLNLYAFVGIIMLVGIVKKNAIIMIDFAIAAQRNEGKNAREAIYEGALVRFRPIMMTTMAALVGTLPIALGYGAGGESRRPLGLAVVGGLVVSQVITLYITPVYFIYLESFQNWVMRVVRRKKTEASEAELAEVSQVTEAASSQTQKPVS
jgi:hydrophobic/amphiphilic exporter-1 (mainly G- bacteria), HAE1 family